MYGVVFDTVMFCNFVFVCRENATDATSRCLLFIKLSVVCMIWQASPFFLHKALTVICTHAACAHYFFRFGFFMRIFFNTFLGLSANIKVAFVF